MMDGEFQFLMYRAADEDVAVNAVIKDETIWLTQKSMAELFMSKYLTYLPTKEQLRREIKRQMEIFYMQHPAPLEEDGEKDEQAE